MRERGFIVCSIFLLISLVTALAVLAPLKSDTSVHRSAFVGQYMELDAARKVGLDIGEAWVLKNTGTGYAPRAVFSSTPKGLLEERIAALSGCGASVGRVDFPGGIAVEIFVADLDYPAALFGEKGSNIPRLPISESANETGRYYLIRSTARDLFSQFLSAEGLFQVSVDHLGGVAGVRRIFYRCR